MNARDVEMEKWYSYLLRENAYGFGIQGFTLMAGIVSAIIFPTIMGKTEFGYFTLSVAMATAWLLLADGGINQVVLKFIPEKGAVKAGSYYAYLVRIKFVLSFASSLILFLLSDYIAILLNMPEVGPGLKFSSLVLFIWSFTTFFENVLFALKRSRDVFISNSVYQILRVGFPLAFYVYFFREQWVWAVGGLVVACVIYLLILSNWINGRVPKSTERFRGSSSFMHYWRYSFFGYLGTVLFLNLDPIVIGLSQGPEQIAAYRVAWLWIASITLFSASANKIFFSAHSRENLARSKAIVSRGITYAFVGSFLFIPGIILLSGKLLTFFYSGKYAESYAVMAVLSFLVLETTLNAVSVPVLLGKGRIRLQTLLALIAGGLQLSAMLIVTPAYGIIGTALCVVVVRVIFSLIVTGYAVSVLRVSVPIISYVIPIVFGIIITYLLLPYTGLVNDIPGVLAFAFGVTALYSIPIFLSRLITVGEIRDLIRSSLPGN